jgi:tetraacyldisaccharide 4'-kinase
VISGVRRTPDAAVARAVLGALGVVYAGGLKLYLLPYGTGLRRQARLPCPVISVGNITVGGTGKTSMTQRVGEFLHERGVRICVLSRGYRGANENGVAVVSTEKRVELDAAAAGDEAYMLASMLPGVPVIVGRDRRASGALACERFHPDIIVLDDGMQYYQLHRDLDIAMLDARRPFDNGRVFPRGLMREPPSHLRRTGIVVISNADRSAPDDVLALRSRAGKLAPRAGVFTAHYAPIRLRALDRSGEQPVGWLDERRVATFCALGNPRSFEEQIANAGAEIVHSLRFPDHRAATMADLNALIAVAQEHGAEAVIVTEKDAVKLPPLGRPLPFHALVVRQVIDD